MELRARLFPLGAPSQARLAMLLAPLPKATSARYPVSLADPALPRILGPGDTAGGFWVAGEAVFSSEELETITHFEAVCRLLVRESERDQRTNGDLVRATPETDAGGFAPIRLARGFVLSKIAIKPNAVGLVGDWTGEYVAGAALTKALAEARCTGYTLEPILRAPGGEAHPDFRQLASDRILPPVQLDRSIERLVSDVAEEHGRLRALGCLTYRPEDLADAADFSRTAEPWAGAWGFPSWIVSARVRSLFKDKQLRGWAFRPVLLAGAGLHREYVAAWERLADLVAASPESRFDGGRW
jgi:hypothetical protein